jgi:UDP-N-acetylglucosamine diphosphorylase/glucosamine-1-phosphate N-acetyltransferase
MNYILFDDGRRFDLLPLTFMRPVADIRVGILTIREKWEHFLNTKTSSLTEDYLSKKFPIVEETNNILINGCVIPDAELVKLILDLEPGQALVDGECIVAQHITEEELSGNAKAKQDSFVELSIDIPYKKISYPWEIFQMNDDQIRADYAILTAGRKSASLSPTNRVAGNDIFVEEGAVVEFATINTNTGPVYIGKSTEIMEGALIRGPFALLDNSLVRMGSKIYGATTVGPNSKIGGELSNVVIFGNSNKVHDGFLGNSVIAEWCNLGAGTSCSNLKNTYDLVKVWNYSDQTFINTGLQFCGLIMGDHSKSGINTMFNTGTVVGVSANIFGGGFPRQFIASFSWGGSAGFKTFDLKKAIAVSKTAYSRRNKELDEETIEILREVFNYTWAFRQL